MTNHWRDGGQRVGLKTARRQRGGRSQFVFIVAAATVFAVLPPFLLGASGIFLRSDLGMDAADIGLMTSLFFSASSGFSMLGGRLADRLGARCALLIATSITGATLLAIGTFVHTVIGLGATLVVGGLASGLSQPATNLALASGVGARRGLDFGIKQAAVPAASLVAGVSVPVVALTLGWRWSFIAGGVLSVAVYVAIRRTADSAERANSLGGARRASTKGMVALTAGIAVATAAATSLPVFLIEAATTAGFSPRDGGWLLAFGSLLGIGMRILMGWHVDRREGGVLHTIAIMLVTGSIGYVMLGSGRPVLVLVGTMVAFPFGWGWTGLFQYAVVRLNPGAPGTASGIGQVGTSAGAAVGPFVFGWIIVQHSVGIAWRAAAAAALAAAVLVWSTRHLVGDARANSGPSA